MLDRFLHSEFSGGDQLDWIHLAAGLEAQQPDAFAAEAERPSALTKS
ncbi:MAG: hypothetical protein ACK58M_04565 [Acidobacteriota bacterium]|jgi:hypothetical protein